MRICLGLHSTHNCHRVWVCVYVCVCMSVCVYMSVAVAVSVCVRERGRERERGFLCLGMSMSGTLVSECLCVYIWGCFL